MKRLLLLAGCLAFLVSPVAASMISWDEPGIVESSDVLSVPVWLTGFYADEDFTFQFNLETTDGSDDAPIFLDADLPVEMGSSERWMSVSGFGSSYDLPEYLFTFDIGTEGVSPGIYSVELLATSYLLDGGISHDIIDGPFGDNLFQFAVTPSQVPIPGNAILFSSAILALVGLRRRGHGL
jgi:hypothetical protein